MSKKLWSVDGLRQVVTFLTTLYIPYFISSSIGCDAAVNDLQTIFCRPSAVLV